MPKDKKKFKETIFGKLLLKTIPSAGGLVGNLLPDSGVLGIVKNLIGGAKDRGEITEDEATMLNAEADRELEYYKIDQEDRASARTRQVDFAKLGKSDWMMAVSGIFAFLGGIAILYVVLFVGVDSEKELFYFVAGATFTWITQIMNFFWGSSKGSKDKDLPRT